MDSNDKLVLLFEEFIQKQGYQQDSLKLIADRLGSIDQKSGGQESILKDIYTDIQQLSNSTDTLQKSLLEVIQYLKASSKSLQDMEYRLDETNKKLTDVESIIKNTEERADRRLHSLLNEIQDLKR